jgi:ubiquinone biosynthesis protein COQ9
MLAPKRAAIYCSISCRSRAIPLLASSLPPLTTAFKGQRQSNQHYHSYEHDSPPGPYSKTEDAILLASMHHVPNHGFTEKALALGAKDSGYLDVSINLFPRRAFELVNYHLVSQRGALKDRLDFTELERDAGKSLGVGTKIRMLAWKRLMANSKIIHRWQEVGLDFLESRSELC